MNTLVSEQTLLDWESIKQLYPDSWVMIGYPESEYQQIPKARKGSVLYAHENSELTSQFSADNIAQLREKKAYRLYTIKYTGEIPKPSTPRLGLFLRKIQEN